jgi:hypothetical protein
MNTGGGVAVVQGSWFFVAGSSWLLYINPACEAAFITLTYRYKHKVGLLVGTSHFIHISLACV